MKKIGTKLAAFTLAGAMVLTSGSCVFAQARAQSVDTPRAESDLQASAGNIQMGYEVYIRYVDYCNLWFTAKSLVPNTTHLTATITVEQYDDNGNFVGVFTTLSREASGSEIPKDVLAFHTPNTGKFRFVVTAVAETPTGNVADVYWDGVYYTPQ